MAKSCTPRFHGTSGEKEKKERKEDPCQRRNAGSTGHGGSFLKRVEKSGKSGQSECGA